MMTYNGDETGWEAHYVHGWEALACAVIKQWIKDGRPKGCDLQPWYDMIAIAEELHNPPSRGAVPTTAWNYEK